MHSAEKEDFQPKVSFWGGNCVCIFAAAGLSSKL